MSDRDWAVLIALLLIIVLGSWGAKELVAWVARGEIAKREKWAAMNKTKRRPRA